METRLDLTKLAPYLPYSLKWMFGNTLYYTAWMSTKNISVINPKGYGELEKFRYKNIPKDLKPILRPLSDLLTLFDSGNYEMWQEEWIEHLFDFQDKVNEVNLEAMPYDLMECCFVNHIDVFGLIEAGLAIDKNTLG